METFKGAFLAKYPKCGIVLDYFREATDKPMSWGNLSRLNLSLFITHMGETLAQNSVRQYCAKIKSVLNAYADEVDLPKDWKKILTVRGETVVNVWLTDAELEKLADYVPRTPVEKSVRGRFLLESYTGARFSDAERLDLTNLDGRDITYISQKTHTRASIPCKPILMPILAENRDLQTVSTVTFNDTLRAMCRRVGINATVHAFRAGNEITDEKWKLVTSHTGRRSFATNLYLRGCDLYSISRMMGHSSVEMTAKRYICCPMRELSDNIMEYFD